MNVIEIFDSIDGEGKFAGCLATFIRLAGCNLRCTYCDTAYAFTGDNDMSISEIVSVCKKIGNKHITITGGEPLIHKDINRLIPALYKRGFVVNIETNGSVDISPYLDTPVIITMDYKTISSGVNDKMYLKNLENLRSCDVLKIVCCEEDFKDIKAMLRTYNIYAPIYISPIYGKITPDKLVEFQKELRDDDEMPPVRLQLQLHKIIWDTKKRGV